MNYLLKQSLINLLSFFKVFPVKQTPKIELLNFLNLLKPVKTNTDLIRLGPQGDGGYLVPDDLSGIGVCFSPGVSYISGFEEDCFKQGMKIFLADKSVDKPDSDMEFDFTKKFIGAINSEDYMTLDNWYESKSADDDSDMILQMDIEGYEYESLLSVSDSFLKKCRIIVIEFHGLHQLFNKPYFDLSSVVFRKILVNHKCVHIHPNNAAKTVSSKGIQIPPGMEFTFYRKDRIKEESSAEVFPHSLDCDNTSGKSIALPECWYSRA